MSELERPTREQEALSEMAATRLSPGVGRTLAALLLGLMLCWWVAEALGGGVAWAGLAASFRAAWAAADGFFPANRALSAELATIGRAFDRESAFARTVRPPVQALLTGLLGAGNEQAYPGRAGWVYFRADVDYLTGSGFLERRELAATEGSRPTPDPRPAILELHRALAARGIELLLLPAPVKPAIHPEGLGGAPARAPLRNPSELTFFTELAREGVRVLDVAPWLAERSRAGEPQYLRGDSHWRPETVEKVAARAASVLREIAALPPPSLALERVPVRVAARGDSVALLGLPAWALLFADEEVVVRHVVGRDGQPWRPQRGAPVLLLGDSFANVFSTADLGWGEGAGLAEQLAFELGLPVDRLSLNAGGARGAREELARELSRGEDRLVGVRVVVWQFASRDLAAGDWTRFGFAKERAAEKRPATVVAGFVSLRGVVRAVAPLPAPGSAPYREALGAIELELEDGGRALVYLWARRDGEPGELAAVAVGAPLALSARAWSEADGELGSLQRFELPGSDWWDLPVYWGEEVER